MYKLHFAENLTRLRKEKQLTQEQLADFCEVTKASVSKWETAQTMPDVLMLPKLAAYFGVTIDELLGYEPYLSKEQILKIYKELANDFATEPFDVAMKRCREYVKKYYSCYEFLKTIVHLWLAHEVVAGENRMEMLREAKELCIHILNNCRTVSLCNDVIFLQSILDLLLGQPDETIEALEEMNNPLRLSIQSEEVLLSAYIEKGMLDKGNDFAQVSMYFHVLMLISISCRFLEIHKGNLEKCEETKRRIDEMIGLYNVEQINFHYVTEYVYRMAKVYAYHNEKRKTVEELSRYVSIFERVLRGEISYLQSDGYMDRLHIWFEESALTGGFPREKGTIYEAVVHALEAPEFDLLKSFESFLTLQARVKDADKIVG